MNTMQKLAEVKAAIRQLLMHIEDIEAQLTEPHSDDKRVEYEDLLTNDSTIYCSRAFTKQK